MNLLEIQDKLNKLPPVPQSVQYLTAAAQGGNPQVPPYMALARISEINKQLQESQNKPQPPAEPLNQSLPKQAMQNMGIGALAPAMPQAPQGMPPQGMPQGAPQAAPQQQAVAQGVQPPQAMARGGLTSIPVNPRMFEYGSGGVVAFGVGGGVGSEETDETDEGGGDGEEDDTDVGEDSEATGADINYNAVEALKELKTKMEGQLGKKPRDIRSPTDIQKDLIAKGNYGMDKGPIGEEYLKGLAALKAEKDAERATQTADLDTKRKLAARKALADWSEASRGQTGFGGANAYTRSMVGAEENLLNERAALREAGIKTNELLNEAKYKIQELRRAQLKGDVAGEHKAQTELAKIAKDLHVSENKLIGAAMTGNFNVLGKQIMAKANVDAAAKRAAAKGAGGAKKPTDLNTSYEIELAALLEAGEPNDATTRKKAMNLAQAQLSKSAGTERNRITSVKDANEEFANRILFDREARKLKSDPAKYKARAEEIRKQVETEFGILPTAPVTVPTTAPAPSSTPAPTEGSITPEAFQAKWAKLKPGQKLVGPDGKTYTKG